jgi:ribokinase
MPAAAAPTSPSSSTAARLLLLSSATAVVAGASFALLLSIGAAQRRRRRIGRGTKKEKEKAALLQVSIIGDAFCDVIVSGIAALPEWGGDELAARPISMAAGGSALNTAVQLGHLAKLCLDSSQAPPSIVLHTALGDDLFGRFLREQVAALSSSKGQAPLVHLSTATPSRTTKKTEDGSSDKTGVCICLSGVQDRAFITHRGVIATFSAAQLDLPLLHQAHVVVVGGYYNCPGLWRQLPALLAECRGRGGFTVLSPQHDASGQWAGLESVLPHLDLFIPNEAEARAISRVEGVEAAARFFVEKVSQ